MAAREQRDEQRRALLDGDLFLLRSALGVALALGPQLRARDRSDLPGCRDVCRDGPRGLSAAAFRECVSSCELEARLCRPLARWVEVRSMDPAEPSAPAIEL